MSSSRIFNPIVLHSLFRGLLGREQSPQKSTMRAEVASTDTSAQFIICDFFTPGCIVDTSRHRLGLACLPQLRGKFENSGSKTKKCCTKLRWQQLTDRMLLKAVRRRASESDSRNSKCFHSFKAMFKFRG